MSPLDLATVRARDRDPWQKLEIPTFEHMISMPCHEQARHSTCAVQDMAARFSLPAWASRINAACFASVIDFDDMCSAQGVEGSEGVADEEAALICLAGALDFGSGWRDELRCFHGKSAWQTVKQGIENLSLMCPELRADWLSNLAASDVAKVFGLEHAEGLDEFVQLLLRVLNELGDSLMRRSCRSLSEFMITLLEEVRGDAQAAAKMVRALADTFPTAFKDQSFIKHLPIYFYKKAQDVVYELYERFHLQDSRFDFPDVDSLTGSVDPIIISILRKEQVVMTTRDLAMAIEGEVALPSGELAEVSLRAAAVAALEDITLLARLKGYPVSPVMLGHYLWGCLGKSDGYMSSRRHITRDTTFY
ncbi:unnamed protein product [Effrenium voratum]|nr:unnamed protein product [Effrenium voratum]